MKMYCLYCGSIKDSLLSDVLRVCVHSVCYRTVRLLINRLVVRGTFSMHAYFAYNFG